LVEHFAEVPVLVIAAIWGTHDSSGRPGLFDSVLQAAWSFNLALRSRGLGAAWTTLLNAQTDDLADVLGIPAGVTTVVTFPVAYTRGTEFARAPRRPAAEITYFDQWGFTRSNPSADGEVHLADGQGVVVEIDCSARPKALWPIVSNISVPARFSDELVEATWSPGRPPGRGATFVGRNRRGERSWQVACHVTEWDPPNAFEWRTRDPDNPGAVWRFEITEQGSGSRLRFSMCIGAQNNALATHLAEDDTDESAMIQRRRQVLKHSMQATVEGIAHLATQQGG
jgi:hypothetical protein